MFYHKWLIYYSSQADFTYCSDEMSSVPETGTKTDKATDTSLIVLEREKTLIKLPQVSQEMCLKLGLYCPLKSTRDKGCETLIY